MIATPGLRLASLALLALAACGVAPACTLVVDTAELQRGDAALRCSSDQKICSDAELPGRSTCVSKTNPTYGCSADSCAACALPNAASRCANNGECAIATCQGAHFDCNERRDDGCEVDLGRDEDNCGSCTNVCRASNGVTSCSSGECVIVFCSDPFANCDGKYSNGCETDLLASQQHCGACKSRCAGSCVDGVCKP